LRIIPGNYVLTRSNPAAQTWGLITKNRPGAQGQGRRYLPRSEAEEPLTLGPGWHNLTSPRTAGPLEASRPLALERAWALGGFPRAQALLTIPVGSVGRPPSPLD